ncbi:MAG TPA: hypothetical protein VEQ42_11285 [Pyrinomonadaceae bacterium]|nr:hypothetical protein [Pyrinomonadaceae bacterium]
MPVYSNRLISVSALAALLLALTVTAAARPQQQRQPQSGAPVAKKSADATGEAASDAPPFPESKGVRLGMTADDARRKLGNPQDKSEQQDVYSFSGDKETAQIYYQAGKVSAISVTYIDAGAAAPTAKSVFGEAVETKQDGSVYKMERYPKAGYWLSYTRTSGDAPMVVVTMKSID